MLKALIGIICFLSAGCSSEPESPVGSEFLDDSTLGSRPGTVFEDTLLTPPGDNSFEVSSTLAKNTFLTLGTRDDYKSSTIIKIDFSNAWKDSAKVVKAAFLRLRFTDQQSADILGAKFYEMLSPYNEADTIKALEHAASAIPDSGLVNVEREIKLLGNYSLPPNLVQSWIRGDSTHNGIAIVTSDTTLSTQITLGSRENGDASLHPFLNVDFWNASSSNYPLSGDATFVTSLSSTSNLVISDGYTRRIHIPVDLSGIIEDAIIHRAELVLGIIPQSALGNEFDVFLYVPDDVTMPGILSGRGVTKTEVKVTSESLEISVRNILLLFQAGNVANNGFVLQFDNEGSQIRQVEFYPTSADSTLRPRLRLTYSSSPDFD